MKSHRCLRTAVALWRSRDGVAALEFAMIAPFLILLLVAAASFGVAFRMQMEVGNAARVGANYAALYGYDQTKIKAAAQGATTLATNVTVTANSVTASCTDPSTGAITSAGGAKTCPATGSAPGTYVTVTTQMPYTFLLPLPGMAQTTTLTAQAVARTQ